MKKDKGNILTRAMGLVAICIGIALKFVLKDERESNETEDGKERRTRLNVKEYVKSAAILCLLLVLFLGPLSFAKAGWVGFSLLLVGGLLIGLGGPWVQDQTEWRIRPLASVLTFGFITGVIAILIVNFNLDFLSFPVVELPTWIILGVIGGTAGGLLAAFFNGEGSISKSWLRRLVMIFAGTLCGVLTAGVARLIPAANGMPKGPVILWLMHGAIMGAALDCGLLLGYLSGRKVKPMMVQYAVLWRCLREIGVLLIPFALGYIATIFIFAGYYWCASRVGLDNSIDAHSFGNALYASVGAITLYTDIGAKSPVTKLIVTIEIVIGLGWITFVFGTVAGALQKCFIEEKQKI